jgi:hypothetical protein
MQDLNPADNALLAANLTQPIQMDGDIITEAQVQKVAQTSPGTTETQGLIYICPINFPIALWLSSGVPLVLTS